MTEEQILAKLPRKHRNLILGIGDDCAIYRPKNNEDLVFTTDLFIEGVHFKQRDPVELSRRALARSLSDIASMGAKPLFCLLSLAAPKWASREWIEQFFEGLLAYASETNTALAGGDLSHARQLICDVMVAGVTPQGQALRRDGAKPGHGIYVSGPLGGWRHKTAIVPRLNEGQKLRGKASACIDISDGLALDLYRLCVASRVSAALDDIPLLPKASLKQALHDGEDYELLYTAPPRSRIAGTRIGTITEGHPGTITLLDKTIEPTGYDHFARPRS